MEEVREGGRDGRSEGGREGGGREGREGSRVELVSAAYKYMHSDTSALT